MRPGILLVLAKPFFPVIELIAVDFPELERPINATSTPWSVGSWSNWATLFKKTVSGKTWDLKVIFRLIKKEKFPGLYVIFIVC